MVRLLSEPPVVIVLCVQGLTLPYLLMQATMNTFITDPPTTSALAS